MPPDLIPVPTFIHATKRKPHVAIRWKSPGEPLSETERTPTAEQVPLNKFLADAIADLYLTETHWIKGNEWTFLRLIRVAELLPDTHPLKEKVVKAALIHGILSDLRLDESAWEAWWRESPLMRQITELKGELKHILEEVDPQMPPPPKQERFTPFKVSAHVSLKGKSVRLVDLSVQEVSDVMEEQWVDDGLGERWKKWAMEQYGSISRGNIKEGVVSRLVERLIADKEFVSAFANSPLNFTFESTRDALGNKSLLRESIHKLVNGLVGLWNATASGVHPLAYALQIAVAQEFGLKDRYKALLEALRHLEGLKIVDGTDTSNISKEVAFLYNTLKPILHAFIRAVYQETQDFLAKTGLKRIRLVRGVSMPAKEAMGLPKGRLQLIEAPFFPASSWSLDYDTAETFKGYASGMYGGVGVIYFIEIPKSAFPCILSTALTGFGCYDQMEFVLMMPSGQQVWAAREK
jgi:hypothetical protein